MAAEDAIKRDKPAERPTVLVVEDEALPRLAVCEYLRDCGFNVVEAASGVEAQTLILAGLQVNLVFSDITMPGGVDGMALALWLKERGVDAPIVLTSGLPDSLHAAESACQHVRGFVNKPYDYENLSARFRTLLAGD